MKFEGLLLIDKPAGLTSHDVVDRVRRLLGTRRVGHAGTLDPMATGLLVVLVERATRLSDYLLTANKTYDVTVSLGQETDTQDAEGEITAEYSGMFPSQEDIVGTVISTRGVLSLPIPQYSAVKVNGKKLYEYAREGKALEPIMRDMYFESVEVTDCQPTRFCARVSCAKGTYIRAWASEIGRRLGVGGHVSKLRRVLSAPYTIEQAITLEDLQNKFSESPLLEGTLGAIPLERTLTDKYSVCVPREQISAMKTGRIPGDVIWRDQKGEFKDSVIRLQDASGRLLGVLKRNDSGHLGIGCVFC